VSKFLNQGHLSRFFLYLLGVSLTGFTTLSYAAGTFFFPDINPTYYPREAPAYLVDGYGNDGYITITSEVVPVSSCVSLGNKSFWGSEQTQLLISITRSGFYGQTGELEIPVATFDGRDKGNQCASLSTVPLKIVSNSLLKPFSRFNPGSISLIVNVKTATDANNDLVGSAQFLLGAAAIVATGGMAASIAGATSVLANPVISDAQKRTQDMLKGSLNGKVPMTFGWPEIRNGVEMIEIPIYRAEGSLGTTPDKKIQALQLDPKANKTQLLTVKLSFTYTKTIFDPSASGINDLPNREGISATNVLNHPTLKGGQNFLQLLNDRSPSLLQQLSNAEGSTLTNACSIGFEKLKNEGLNHLDTAIVMKSFIDEAKKGSDWYSKPSLVKACFSQAPNLQVYLPQIYGEGEPKFVIGDVQDGFGAQYTNWKDAIGPTLNNFRLALLSQENRFDNLVKMNGGKDIELSFSPDMVPWANYLNTSDNLKGIRLISEQMISKIGCFANRDKQNLNSRSLASYAIMQDEKNMYFLTFIELAPEDKTKLAKLKVMPLTSDWISYLKKLQFPGGDCAGILNSN
jgi:hypothetical protein